MTQVVKLEPGDILVIANCGRLFSEWDDHDDHLGWIETLRDELQLGKILLFEGDVDLSALPAGWTPDAVAEA